MVVNGIALMMARMSLQGVDLGTHGEESEAAAHARRQSGIHVSY